MCRIISLIGPPGSGKGTAIKHVITPHCESEKIPLVVIPMSKELSLYLDENPTGADRIRADMASGRIVEDAVVINVLNRALDRVERPEGALYVLDGMPRTMGQFEACLYGAAKSLGVSVKDYLFLGFNTPPHLWGYRAAKRDEGRIDDQNEESFLTRCDEYESKTVAVLDHIRKNHLRLGVGYQEINGRYVRSQPEVARGLIFGHQG